MGYICLVFFLLKIYFTKANVVPETAFEVITMPLLPEELVNATGSGADKSILRYGFHRTEQCQDFDKAYLCIKKCLDFRYQIAHADKHCECKCFRNNDLAKYSVASVKPTQWKFGAPTTSLPAWAHGAKIPLDQVRPINNEELYADISVSEEEHDAEGEHGTEHSENAGTEPGALNGPADGVTGGDGVTGADGADGGGGGDGADGAGGADGGGEAGAEGAADGAESENAAER